MKVEFKPNTTWSGGSNVDSKASVKFQRDGMNYTVSANDHTFGVHGGGISTRGVSFSVEQPGAFTMDYDVDNNSPTFTLHSSANLVGKDVKLKYKHGVQKNAASLEGAFKVDGKHSGTLRWNLQNYSHPDHKALNLKWKYKHNDKWTAEPEYDFGSDSLRMAVTHDAGDNGRLKAHMDFKTNGGGLEWNKSQSDGNMKVTMKSTMNQKCFMNDMCVGLEKTFNFDV